MLELTTTGRRSGRPHRIEIWFIQLGGRYYLCSERGERAHWVQNLQRRPVVVVTIGTRTLAGRGRVLSVTHDAALIARVRRAFNAKYGWCDGLFVEITPDARG